MTSGLAWDETYDLGTPITQMLYDEPDMGGFVAGQPLAHEPGTYQQYSSGSTTLLCAVLTERTGVGADLPRQQLFAPLGLTSRRAGAGRRRHAGVQLVPVGDAARLGGDRPVRPPGRGVERRAAAARGLDGDLHHGGRRSQTEEEGYAAGWWVEPDCPTAALVEPSLPADAYFAEGHDGQWIVVVPSADLVVVRLGFSPEVDDVGAVDLAAELVAAEPVT